MAYERPWSFLEVAALESATGLKCVWEFAPERKSLLRGLFAKDPRPIVQAREESAGRVPEGLGR